MNPWIRQTAARYTWVSALVIAGLTAALSTRATAQTQTDMFNDGLSWAAGKRSGAAGSVNAATGAAVVPGYGSSAKEATFYGGGKGLVGSAGISKQVNCVSSTAATPYLQQECDVVNYLNHLLTKAPYPMTAAEPMITGSDPVIRHPGAPGGSSSAQICRTVTQNNPGEYTTETCTTARKTDFPSCASTLSVTVNWLYSCPANTVSGPTPDTSDLSIPQRNTCNVADPYFKLSCAVAGNILTVTGPSTGICTDPVTAVTTPAVQTLAYNRYTTTASVFPDVVDSWNDQCGALAARADPKRLPFPDCEEPTPKVCLQPAETRVINGYPVTRACWQWRRDFACLNPGFDATCGPRASANCTHTGDTCLQYSVDGKCAITSEAYSCEKTPPSVTTQLVCESPSFCQGAGVQCFTTNREPDKDFGIAAAAMETAREGGVYGINAGTVELFKGYGESCSIKVLGGIELKSCCGSNAGGGSFSNFNLLGPAMTVAGAAARSTAVVGSKYVYDALYGTVDSGIVNKGLSAMNNWATGLGDGTFRPSFSFYGFSFDFTLANGFEFTAFDPYSFAFQIGAMMVTQWLSCNSSEQTLALKKGQNLCVTLGSSCTRRLWLIGTCLEVTENSCCFNSLLAKIINRQGRAQLGLGAGSCGGFSEDQLNAINFAAMDFSEFIQTIVPAAADIPGTLTRVGDTVTKKVNNYYGMP